MYESRLWYLQVLEAAEQKRSAETINKTFTTGNKRVMGTQDLTLRGEGGEGFKIEHGGVTSSFFKIPGAYLNGDYFYSQA